MKLFHINFESIVWLVNIARDCSVISVLNGSIVVYDLSAAAVRDLTEILHLKS